MRRLAPALLATSLFLAACSDVGNQAPTPSEPSAPEATLVNPPGCPTDAQMAVQIHNLFPKPLEGPALVRYAAIRAAMIANKTTLARQLMYATVDWTLKQYNAGSLIGGKSAATQARVTTFINSLYCIVGLTAPTIPPGALGIDGAVAIVSPSSTPTDVVTESRIAGIEIPPNGVTQPTLITVSRVAGPLLTQLDQYPLYYEFRSDQPLNQNAADAVVGVCIAKELTISPETYARLRVAHNVPDPTPTTIEILPLVPVLPFALNCDNATSLTLGPSPTLRQFASWGLARAGQALRDLLEPAPLSASFMTTTGLGGTTKKLSPFGVVDTLITVSANSPTTITGLAGSSVTDGALPSVKVATPLGHPVTNYPVSFSVPAGSEGTITGGAATTDGSGIATVGSWTLGTSLGADLVNAAVAPPHLHSFVSGTPVLFTANVISTTLLSYKSAAYAYEVLNSDSPDTTGWQTSSFTGASNWPTGAAGFGFNFAADQCSIVSDIQTAWPGATTISNSSEPSNTSDLLLRKSVTIPNGWTGSLSIGVAIDNDVQVFVNGTNITASAGTPVNGFMVHEGCATRGSLVFSAPNNFLVPGGTNLIAVHARDRGRTSYFDMEVKLVP